jgi:hypothetical protein
VMLQSAWCYSQRDITVSVMLQSAWCYSQCDITVSVMLHALDYLTCFPLIEHTYRNFNFINKVAISLVKLLLPYCVTVKPVRWMIMPVLCQWNKKVGSFMTWICVLAMSRYSTKLLQYAYSIVKYVATFSLGKPSDIAMKYGCSV